MRLANLGYTPDEIAAEVDLPPGLWADWTCHGYYGTLSHNVRAVYQRHFGFYDGHPSSLHPYPPVESAQRYVEYMGGIDNLVANAKRSFDAGDYRWVAQVLRHAVFADPTNQQARSLQADAFEQLAYQAESGPWRDIYLTGAKELREGTPSIQFPSRPSSDAIGGMTFTQIFDYLAVRLDGPAAVELGHQHLVWYFTDTAQTVHLELSNGTLHSRLEATKENVSATITSTRQDLDRLVGADLTIESALATGAVVVEGSSDVVVSLWNMLTTFNMFFAIIEP